MPFKQNVCNNDPMFVLQDDNARPHRARVATQFLQQNNITRMEWPACSPDLSPIENAWDKLGKAVQERVQPNSTLNDLERMLKEEWRRQITPAYLRRILGSMHKRCLDVIAAQGDSIDY